MFEDANLFSIFLTGLLTGGLTCIAVQGGLLTAALVQRDGIKKYESGIRGRNSLIPVLIFIFAKLLAYTILGFFLGWIGSLLELSIQARIVLQFAVIIFMLGTALNLLNVHPIFRIFLITPPRFVANLSYKYSDKGVFAAVLLGLFTVLIPCGATQAMMALAVASGNPLLGAIIMFVFVLGTSPVFFLLGAMTVKLGMAWNKQSVNIAAFIILFLALFNLDASLSLANSPLTIRTAVKNVFCVLSFCDSDSVLQPSIEHTITLTPNGYFPNRLAVPKGEEVTLHLINQNATGCIQAFTMSSLNIQKIVKPNEIADVTFRAPIEPGKITFTCSSGLYPGTIEII